MKFFAISYFLFVAATHINGYPVQSDDTQNSIRNAIRQDLLRNKQIKPLEQMSQGPQFLAISEQAQKLQAPDVLEHLLNVQQQQNSGNQQQHAYHVEIIDNQPQSGQNQNSNYNQQQYRSNAQSQENASKQHNNIKMAADDTTAYMNIQNRPNVDNKKNHQRASEISNINGVNAMIPAAPVHENFNQYPTPIENIQQKLWNPENYKMLNTKSQLTKSLSTYSNVENKLPALKHSTEEESSHEEHVYQAKTLRI